MKKVYQIILKLLGLKVADLDNDGKIETLRDEIQGLLSGFSSINEKLQEAQKKYDEIIEDENITQEIEKAQLEQLIKEAEARFAESDMRIDKAQSEKDATAKVQEKIQDFIV